VHLTVWLNSDKTCCRVFLMHFIYQGVESLLDLVRVAWVNSHFYWHCTVTCIFPKTHELKSTRCLSLFLFLILFLLSGCVLSSFDVPEEITICLEFAFGTMGMVSSVTS
jgi:hypothetical protein